jgi:hypothetical protein
MSIKAVLEKLATYTGGVLNASDVIVFAESHPKSALHSQFDWCTTRAQWPSPSPHQGSADEAASRRGGRGQSMTQVDQFFMSPPDQLSFDTAQSPGCQGVRHLRLTALSGRK